ncbi:MAG TPA: GrpB family protein [Actinomycetes bacterium]|nr:GrpB family protein [Actinomycetes bacterium]
MTTNDAVDRDEPNDVYVLGQQRLRGEVQLVAYDSQWQQDYDRVANIIRSVLGDQVGLLEHIGSTSVRGLSAKPIIDIVLAVPDSSDEKTYVAPLETVGFVLTIREQEWFEHRLLKGPDVDINLHVFSVGCPEIERNLRFRDWLRAHDDDRDLYERTKQELASHDWEYVQQYADAKSEVVEKILARAEAATG